MAAALNIMLSWTQGSISGVLPTTVMTKANELKLLLGATSCAAVIDDTVEIKVKKGSGPFKTVLEAIVAMDPEATVGPLWSLVLSEPGNSHPLPSSNTFTHNLRHSTCSPFPPHAGR